MQEKTIQLKEPSQGWDCVDLDTSYISRKASPSAQNQIACGVYNAWNLFQSFQVFITF